MRLAHNGYHIQIEVIAIFPRNYGAHMNISFIIKVKILTLINSLELTASPHDTRCQMKAQVMLIRLIFECVGDVLLHITLFRSITMLYGNDSIPRNIRRYSRIYSVEYYQSHRTLLWIWIMLCIIDGYWMSCKLIKSHNIMHHKPWQYETQSYNCYNIFV